ncbi:MAG: TetR/AcrR family transcriptional regulator [Pseudomonadota bacterium]
MAKKRLPAKERKREILVSAVKVFARSNYRAARMADIAAEIDITEAAIYRHFPSKKSIYLQILQHMSDRITAFWQEEVDKEPDALKALRNMGLTYFKRMIRHPDELKVQFQAISEVSDPEIAERLRKDHASYMKFIGRVIQKGKEQGRIRKDVDVETMSWLLNGVGILMNITKLIFARKLLNQKSVERLIDHILDSISIQDN